MEWFNEFAERAREHYLATGEALNEAEAYGVKVVPGNKSNDQKYMVLLGVKHLSPEENHRDHHAYFDVIDEDGERMYRYLIQCVREGGVIASPPPSIEKPLNEPGGNLPMNWDTTWDISVLSVNNQYPSDTVSNVHTRHADEGEGNTNGHHSFFMVWQLTHLVEASPKETPIEAPKECTWVTLFECLFKLISKMVEK